MVTLDKKSSIYRYYKLFAFAAPLVLILLSASIGVIKYISSKQINNQIYSEDSVKVIEIFDDIFKYIEKFCQVAGDRIATASEVNPYVISNILQETASIPTLMQDTFQLRLFDFVLPNGKVIATTTDGILKEEIIVEKDKRLWMKSALDKPWIPQVSFPDISVVIKKEGISRIIPVGYGITNRHNKFLGYISVGIDINKLTRKIKNTLNKDVSLIILTKDFKEVLDLNLAKSDDDYASFVQQVKDHLSTKDKNGKFLAPIKYKETYFSFYQQMENYPYIILFGKNKEKAWQDFQQHILPSIFETLGICLFILLLFYFFRREVISPITTLAKKAQLISQGNVEVELPPANNAELAILTDALHLVKDALKNEQQLRAEILSARNKLADINFDLEQKVEERTFELEGALAAKTEFLNNMSHEIRTPLQGFTLISQGIVDRWHDYDDLRKLELAKQVASNANRLGKLVGNLLDLSKFTAGKMLLDVVKFDLVELAYDLKEECEELYLDNRPITIKIVNQTKSDIFNITADCERIAQVLRNLLFNAIKFSPNDGIITILINKSQLSYDSGSQQEAAYVTIQDTGVGIPELELEAIFSPFTQSSKTKTKAGGTGLGLAICKEIVSAHHGKIWANNRHPAGAEFHFIVPQIYSKLLDDVKIIKQQDADADATIATSKITQTILMIDDENSCHMSMNLLLHGTGYKLILASGGVDGLQMLAERYSEIDIILLDLMMPDIYGLNVLSEIKKHSEYDHIKIILQTGSSDMAEIDKAYILGIDGYIKKPYQKAVILTELAKVS